LLLRWLSIALGGWGLVILLCVPAMARTSHDIHGGNCVAYAREVTGVHLDGNAAAWWPHAEGRYERGHMPQVGAILVFKPYGRMHVGHVAVVSRIVGAREVLVDQANWVRGRVTKAISVVDASPANDWTSVEVQYAGTHGRENPTYGFIYPQVLPASLGEAVAAAEPDKPHAHADRLAARARHHETASDEEVAAYRHAAPRHVAERAKHHEDVDEQEAAAQPEPAPQHAAAHAAHHKSHPANDEAKADLSAQPAQQVAAAKLPVHKHKLPDARLAYVY
jgi:surface antigen